MKYISQYENKENEPKENELYIFKFFLIFQTMSLFWMLRLGIRDFRDL